ncbi:MAG: FAD:protein FMN transferase [Magnetococcales bacterium]|nr:FAD:protein FMN transferase [Magnetococcales bacterium]
MMRDLHFKPIVPLLLLLAFLGFWLLWKNPSHQELHATTRLAMGTLVSVSTWGATEAEDENGVNWVFSRIKEVESWASKQIPSSLVYKINHSPKGTLLEVPEELVTVVHTGLEIRNLSGGAFDPGLGYLVDLWGFGNGVAEEGKIPETQKIAAWLEERNKHHDFGIQWVKTANGGMAIQWGGFAYELDLGGIAKGYAMDLAMESLKLSGIPNALIVAGGDMIIAGSKGGKPWRIGIQHPRDHNKVMAFAEITGDMAMSTSGDYERFFMANGERQHHILDPKTGKPSRSGLISVSIQTSTSIKADALSTAVFVLGMKEGKALIEKLDGVEGMLVHENGERWKSPGFKGQWLEGS